MGVPYQVKVQQKETEPAETAEKVIHEEKKITADDILEDARKEAEKIINDARLKAESILNSASAKAEVRFREAEKKAREEGYKKGEALAREHYQRLINEAEELRKKAKEIHDKTISGMEEEIADLVVQIARKVIGTELVQNRDVVLGLIRNALSNASITEKILIYVSADDYDYVISNREKILEEIKGIRDFEIIRDNSLKKGECLVDTGFGMIDSSTETQIKAVEDTLKDLLGGFGKEDTADTNDEL